MNRKKLKTVDLALIAMFAAMIAICSWISIPATVPFTLQTFGVFLAVGVLGGKRGTLAVATYMLMGAVGIPVFAGFGAGLGHLLGSTGGYVLGFLFSALSMWGIEILFGRKNWVVVLTMTIGLVVCYTFGTVWYMFMYAGNTGTIGIGTVLTICVVPYIVPDVIKMVLALAMRKRLGGMIC